MIRHTPDIELLRQGDKEEFAKIFYEFFDLLFALGYQYTKNHQVAEEMAQETFIGLWEARATLGKESNIRNWLYTVTKNKCLNHLRNELNATRHLNTIRAQELKFAEESMNSLGSTFAEFEELQSRIGSAIVQLPPDLHTVFEMNRFGGLTYGEIARELNLSEKAIEARMSKALKILKAALKDYFPILLIIQVGIF
jgi:RNA polymerase sigma-70 factor, ECF subfamily